MRDLLTKKIESGIQGTKKDAFAPVFCVPAVAGYAVTEKRSM
jgi:hypothetical protein